MKSAVKPVIYLSLILIFVLVDVICDNYVYKSFDGLSVTAAFLVFFALSAVQIFASPVQAGLSTYYGKKKSLVFSLSTTLISFVIIYFYLGNFFPLILAICLAILIKGFLGNTTPLSWAAIADTEDKNFRFSFGLATAGFPIAYFLIITANRIFNLKQAVGFVGLLTLVAVILCLVLFANIKKPLEQIETNSKRKIKKSDLLRKEIKETFHELKNRHIRYALFGYMLWEISQYSILLLYVDFNISQFSSVAVSMLVGYMLTIVVLKFLARIHDKTMMRVGYIFSILLFIPFLIWLPFFSGKVSNYLIICYFFHSAGNAFLSSTLFSLLAKEKGIGEQAVTFGLLDSSDTLAFFISALTVKLYKFLELNINYIIIFSFITVVISYFPYLAYMKTRPETMSKRH